MPRARVWVSTSATSTETVTTVYAGTPAALAAVVSTATTSTITPTTAASRTLKELHSAAGPGAGGARHVVSQA